MSTSRYPKLHIRSKNELAKHIARKRFTQKQALALINDVLLNFDSYWKDSKRSDAAKGKYVRSAKGQPLGTLLQRINWMVLGPHDRTLPPVIFGGVSGKDHAGAASHLLGKKRRRILLKADIKTFFEQVSYQRVHNFFHNKCECADKVAHMLAQFCCVARGPKGSGATEKTLARGFATSSRLAIWCNLDQFIRLQRLVAKRLRGKDPRIVIYVDDIGVTASRATEEEMEALYEEIKASLMTDPNQPLPLNDSKKKIVLHTQGMEHLGINLGRNKTTLGIKTQGKLTKIKQELKEATDAKERDLLQRKRKSLMSYKRHVESK